MPSISTPSHLLLQGKRTVLALWNLDEANLFKFTLQLQIRLATWSSPVAQPSWKIARFRKFINFDKFREIFEDKLGWVKNRHSLSSLTSILALQNPLAIIALLRLQKTKPGWTRNSLPCYIIVCILMLDQLNDMEQWVSHSLVHSFSISRWCLETTMQVAIYFSHTSSVRSQVWSFIVYPGLRSGRRAWMVAIFLHVLSIAMN